MIVEIKELHSFEEFEEMSDIQKKIWHLSDRDIISTITLKALTMNYPMMGFILGAFVNKMLVGFVICYPTREPSTIYALIMGVLEEYRNSEIGNKLALELHKICKKENISKICWTYDPLDSMLGHLYINKWGGIVVKYEKNYYQIKTDTENNIPLDRFIVDCNLLSSRVLLKLKNKHKMRSLNDVLKEFPIATADNLVNDKSVLVQIPNNFNKLVRSDASKALAYRQSTRFIFEEYINRKSYFIAELISGELDGEKKYFYLLEKRSYI